MRNTPFRVLFREFLFRVIDLELLAPKGDMSKLLGQFAALLIFVSLGFALMALGVDGARNLPHQLALMLTWSGEHFLIATTMLVVGLFAVLSWDSTFPNRRDVFVLMPLPIRARTLLLAKVAAVATALSLTVVTLHAVAGLLWPAALHSVAAEQPTPALTYQEALPPVDLNGLEELLNRDLVQTLKPGVGTLAPETGVGAVIGVVHRGERRVFAYGTAEPDSIFEIGSIGKTFTGLLLAQSVEQGRTDLDTPLRALLPRGTVAKPTSHEISLLDLATHRSGLPHVPDNFRPADGENPYADYHVADLYAAISKRGVGRRERPPFEYSNLGYSLLGQALANRAGMSYPELLSQEITGPLGMADTVITLLPEQQARFIPGINFRERPAHSWHLEAMAPAGAGIRSTAGDMLTYLEAQLQPQAASSLTEALKQSHQLRADVADGLRIALGWVYNTGNETYWHNGGTGGFSSYAFFHPENDYAAIVLVNRTPGIASFADLLGVYVRQRLAGEPAVSLENVVVPPSGGFVGLIRFYVAYWVTMLAAGVFVFACVLGLQGIAAQLLPRRWFLKASSFLQLATFCLFVSGFALQPLLVTPGVLIAAQNHGRLYWSPSFWFLGLFQQLNGSPALAPLANRAWIGLAIALSVTATVFLLSYFRTLRKIVEEPDIVPTSRGATWLPRFGSALATAVTQFSIRTLLRSRQHRMLLAFYWGIASAFVLLITKHPAVQKQMDTAGDVWHQPNVPLLLASTLMLCAAIAGVRVVAAVPLELRANWVFQVTPIPSGRPRLPAVRRAVYMLGLVPVWLGSAALFLTLWTWKAAAGHLAVLLLLGVTLTEVCLWGFHKIPFTCSYLPGKSQANMAILGLIPLIILAVKAAGIERQALGDPARFLTMAALLGGAALLARWRTLVLAKSPESELKFDEQPAPVIFALDLHRDGTLPTE